MLEALGVAVGLLVLLIFSVFVVAIIRSFSCCPGCGQFDKELFSEAIQAGMGNCDNSHLNFHIPPVSRRVCQGCGYVLSSGAHLS